MTAPSARFGPVRETAGRRTILDPAVIRRLGDELGDDRAAARVAARFLSLLSARTERLTRYVRGRDAEAALDCVLSLRVTTTVVGGHRVQYEAERLEQLIRAADWAGASPVLVRLLREAGPLAERLQQLVDDLSGTSAT